jgi:hypothetical protein
MSGVAMFTIFIQALHTSCILDRTHVQGLPGPVTARIAAGYATKCVLKDVHTWRCSSLFQHGYTRMPAYCFTCMRDWEWRSFLFACLLIWPNYLAFLIWGSSKCDS